MRRLAALALIVAVPLVYVDASIFPFTSLYSQLPGVCVSQDRLVVLVTAVNFNSTIVLLPRFAAAVLAQLITTLPPAELMISIPTVSAALRFW